MRELNLLGCKIYHASIKINLKFSFKIKRKKKKFMVEAIQKCFLTYACQLPIVQCVW